MHLLYYQDWSFLPDSHREDELLYFSIPEDTKPEQNQSENLQQTENQSENLKQTNREPIRKPKTNKQTTNQKTYNKQTEKQSENLQQTKRAYNESFAWTHNLYNKGKLMAMKAWKYDWN